MFWGGGPPPPTKAVATKEASSTLRRKASSDDLPSEKRTNSNHDGGVHADRGDKPVDASTAPTEAARAAAEASTTKLDHLRDAVVPFSTPASAGQLAPLANSSATMVLPAAAVFRTCSKPLVEALTYT